MWQKGSDAVDGYKNIGATYTQNAGNGVTVNYNQNEAVSMTETVLTSKDFKTQMTGKFDANGVAVKKDGEAGNCYYESGEMVKASGAVPLSGDANGITKTTGEVAYIDKQIDKGQSTRVQVDRNEDGKGDHWVAISSRTTNLTNDEKSYGFADPATTSVNKGGMNNTFKVENGSLRGKANAYRSGKVNYQVVQVRKNKN